MILSLALWFALHVLFAHTSTLRWGPAHLPIPQLASLRPRMLALAATSALLLVRARWSVHGVLAVAAALSLLLQLFLRPS